MNKNRGIWIVLICIVVIGAAVTFATSRYTGRSGAASATTAGMPQMANDSQAPSAYPEQEKLASARDAVTGASPERAAGGADSERAAAKEYEKKNETVIPAPAAAKAVQPHESAESADKAAVPEALAENAPAMMRSAPVPETAGARAGGAGDAPVSAESSSEALSASGALEAQAPVISPLGPDGDSQPEEEDAREYYAEHLAEIDAQIQKMRAEVSDPSTYSMKNLAGKELQLWNLEMNSIYGIITKALDAEGAAILEKSQQTWLKDRDTKAEDTARKYSGGSLEGVEYTASLAESTRQRAYDLVDEYGDVMTKDSGQ